MYEYPPLKTNIDTQNDALEKVAIYLKKIWELYYNYIIILWHYDTLQGTNISHFKVAGSRWFSFSIGGICDRSQEGKIMVDPISMVKTL